MNNPRSTLTLHEAMAMVLRECEDQTADYKYLAAEINRRHLYLREDGAEITHGSIGPRASDYPRMFERIHATVDSPARVRLR